ncbi:MAG TPA: hypothetical protein VIR34_11975, partial [Gemmatimonadaceae bacterium]
MTRSTRSHRAPTPFLMLGALAALCFVAPARAQSTPKASTPEAAAQDSTVDSTAQSAPAPQKRSRFGRFGRVIGKTASKVGISKKTAVRIAINAATGGAADALTHATSGGAASALTRAASAGAANALTGAASAGTAPLPALSAQSGGSEAAL